MEDLKNDDDVKNVEIKTPDGKSIDAKNVDVNKYGKNFNEKGFWNKVKKIAHKVGAKTLYVIFLLYYSIPKVTVVDKAIIIGTLGFLISPFDLILDCIPVIGFMDDVALIMYCYYRVQKHIDNDTREKAKAKLKSILGEYDENEIKDL